MWIEKLPEIWDRFDASDAAELILECGTERLVLRRSGVSSKKTEEKTVSRMGLRRSPAQSPLSDGVPAKPASSEGQMVTAPLVGTFYRAPSPDEDPYVSLGQEVHRGDVLGIVEAMKMMNEITAPCDGVIRQILAEDETLVEFGQALMRIGSKE